MYSSALTGWGERLNLTITQNSRRLSPKSQRSVSLRRSLNSPRGVSPWDRRVHPFPGSPVVDDGSRGVVPGSAVGPSVRSGPRLPHSWVQDTFSSEPIPVETSSVGPDRRPQPRGGRGPFPQRHVPSVTCGHGWESYESPGVCGLLEDLLRLRVRSGVEDSSGRREV